MAWIVPSLSKIVIDFSFAVVMLTENASPKLIISSLFKEKLSKIFIYLYLLNEMATIIPHFENIVWLAHNLNITTEKGINEYGKNKKAMLNKLIYVSSRFTCLIIVYQTTVRV